MDSLQSEKKGHLLPALWVIAALAVAIVSGAAGFYFSKPSSLRSPLPAQFELPLARIYEPYSFPNLQKRVYTGSPIKFERILDDNENYTSYLFSFLSDGKKITGQANIPKPQKNPNSPDGTYPVIVQIRGYVDQNIYQTGVGTAPSAKVFAENGFITLAPDFLGFGESDKLSGDALLDRFENPIIVLNLLASIKTLPQADTNNVFLWGHSNGGQISLSVLEISGRPIPTVLWAPVTKPFPYSILYFMDEAPDGGKNLRKIVANFERDGYDVNLYSIGSYFNDIAAPIELHQGTADDAVPLRWSDQFVQEMKKLGKDITYYTYPDANHNLRPGWDTVVARDITFFRSHLR